MSAPVPGGALRPFYDDEGRLLRYPSRRSLRLPVLTAIARGFEPGRDYTEKEVNGVIRAAIAFDDVELIRRELFEHRLLRRLRDGSRYWREPDPPPGD